MGACLRRLGRREEAATHYEYWIDKFPKNIHLRCNCVNNLIDLGRLQEASSHACEGLEFSPRHKSLLIARAKILRHGGGIEASIAQLECVIRLYPDSSVAWLELGVAHHANSSLTKALDANKKAVELDATCSAAWRNQVILLKELGRPQEALDLFAALSPERKMEADIRSAMAGVLMDMRLVVEAERELAALTKEFPQHAENWVNRAGCLIKLKYINAAIRVLKQGLLWGPGNELLEESLSHCLLETGQIRPGLKMLRKELECHKNISNEKMARIQFSGAAYDAISSAERQILAQRWEKKAVDPSMCNLWADGIRECTRNRRIRIGYLSSDIGDHPVGRFIAPILESHDKEKVETWIISNGPHADEVTNQIRKNADNWINIQYINDPDASRLVADQRLDVLVELGGFTSHSRIGIIARRPAPIQLSYLGYFAPTYLKAIDGWIGDHELFGGLNETDKSAHELIEIEGGYMTYKEKELRISPPEMARRHRFGSFNHSRKIGRDTAMLFALVMNKSPRSELILKSVSFSEDAERQRIRKLLTDSGIDDRRIRILPWVEGRMNHLSCYNEVDTCLDPIPYGGATTTCEALWMGIPVVTLAGEGMMGRLSASILQSAGLSQWIASDIGKYVDIAVELAAKGVRPQESRYELREWIKRSPLANARRLTNALEECYSRLTADNASFLR